MTYACIFNSNLRDQNNILPPRRERERERKLQRKTSDYKNLEQPISSLQFSTLREFPLTEDVEMIPSLCQAYDSLLLLFFWPSKLMFEHMQSY